MQASVASVGSLKTGSLDAVVSRAVGGIAGILGDAPFLRKGGAFLAWTTDRYSLESALGRGFQLERVLRVPGTERKAIALYRFAAEGRP